jgi:hypothetical protein
MLITGELGLLLQGNGVDVWGCDRAGDAQSLLVSSLQQLCHQESSTDRSLLDSYRIERLDPLPGFCRVGIGQLVNILVPQCFSEI